MLYGRLAGVRKASSQSNKSTVRFVSHPCLFLPFCKGLYQFVHRTSSKIPESSYCQTLLVPSNRFQASWGRFNVGGVDHCGSHCRLAKFHGLMSRIKYGAMIGPEARFLYVPSINFQATGCFWPITAPCFTLYIKPRNVAKRHCKLIL